MEKNIDLLLQPRGQIYTKSAAFFRKAEMLNLFAPRKTRANFCFPPVVVTIGSREEILSNYSVKGRSFNSDVVNRFIERWG